MLHARQLTWYSGWHGVSGPCGTDRMCDSRCQKKPSMTSNYLNEVNAVIDTQSATRLCKAEAASKVTTARLNFGYCRSWRRV